MKTTSRRIDRHLAALLALVLAYTAVFSTLWILRYRALFSYEWQDDAARNQMIYNTLRGRPFFSTVKGVEFAGHVSITWAALAAPSLIYPGIETACVLLTLGLALTVVPVYLVARDTLRSRGEALLLAAAFLLYAPLHAVNLATLNAVTPAVPLLAWTYWAFHRRRFKSFLTLALCAMLCKEDIALAVMMFGVLALFRRRRSGAGENGVRPRRKDAKGSDPIFAGPSARRWPWVVAPIAAGALWLVIAFKVILPGTYAQPVTSTSWLIGARESQAAGGPGGAGGAARWILAHPGEAAEKALGPDRWLLFGQLFAPVLLVSFLSPGALLMAVPAFGQLLLHAGPLTLYHRHWIAPALPFIMMATVGGCARAKRFFLARRTARISPLPPGDPQGAVAPGPAGPSAGEGFPDSRHSLAPHRSRTGPGGCKEEEKTRETLTRFRSQGERNRPLPEGEVKPGQSLAYGMVLAVVVVGCVMSNLAPNIIGQMQLSPAWPDPPAEMRDAATVYAPVFYRRTDRSRDAWALIRRIPPGAAVAASGDLLVPLSDRRVLYEFPDTPEHLRDVDYCLINTQAVSFGAGHYWLAVTPQERAQADAGLRRDLPALHHARLENFVAEMLASGEWVRLDRRGDIYLLKRSTSNIEHSTSNAH